MAASHAGVSTASVTLQVPSSSAGMVEGLQIRPTQKHQIDLVRDLLTDGFWDNPGWALIDLHEKHADAEQFINRAIAKLIVGEHSHLIYHGDEVVGHVCLSPENTNVVPSTCSVLRVGWQIPFRFGWRFTKRFINFLNCVEAQTDPIMKPYQPAAMLEWFVVKTEWRGKGIGLHILNNFVTKDSQRVLLITQSAANVRLYERAGFDVITKSTLCTNGRECDNWCMVFEAQAKS